METGNTTELPSLFSQESFDMIDDFLQTQWTKTQVSVFIFSLLGIAINIYAAFFLHRQKTKRLFARLLKSLVISDILVALCCGALWGIPRGVDYYSRSIFPHIAPYLITLSHIAVLASNLFTGILGFERYVRLKYLCNFRYRNWITCKNLNFYRTFVIIFATLFYAPKFFELKTNQFGQSCTDILVRGQPTLSQLYRQLIEEKYIGGENFTKPSQDQYDLDLVKNTNDCVRTIFFTRKMPKINYVTIGATEMRLSWSYYIFYYMGANSIIGHFLPFLLIMILNTSTVIILRRNQRDSSIIVQPRSESTVPENLLEVEKKIVVQLLNEPQCATMNSQISVDERLSKNVISAIFQQLRNKRKRKETFDCEFSDFSRRSSNIEMDFNESIFDTEEEPKSLKRVSRWHS